MSIYLPKLFDPQRYFYSVNWVIGYSYNRSGREISGY